MEALIFKQARARPPLHEADGRYTHGQVRRCIVAADPHDLHLSTRGFAALHAQQLAPCSSSQLFGGSHKLRAQARAERVEDRSEVVDRTIRVRVVAGVGLYASKAKGPGSVNVQRVALL